MNERKNPQHKQYVFTIRLEEIDSVTGTYTNNLINLIVYYDHYSIHVENNDVPIKKFSHLTREKNCFQYASEVLIMFLHI